jgi:hypothetical protein
VTNNNSEGGRVVQRKNPLTNQNFTDNDILKMNRKLRKLGLAEIIVSMPNELHLEFFDHLYHAYAHFGLYDVFGGQQYNNLRQEFIEAGTPFPFRFFNTEILCDRVRDMFGDNRGNQCFRVIIALENDFIERMLE